MTDLTKYIREIITRNGLVNSGRLLNSTTLTLSTQGSVLYINIRTMEYFKFLDMDYKLIEQLTKNPQFNMELEKVFEQNINEFLDDNKTPLLNDIKINYIILN